MNKIQVRAMKGAGSGQGDERINGLLGTFPVFYIPDTISLQQTIVHTRLGFESCTSVHFDNT